MADSWETLVAKATDTTDAWAALNSQQAGGGIPGRAVDEIPFYLREPLQLSATVSPITISGATTESGNINVSIGGLEVTYETSIETAPIAEV